MARDFQNGEFDRSDLMPVDQSLVDDLGRIVNIEEQSEIGAAKEEASLRLAHRSSSRLAEKAAIDAVKQAESSLRKHTTHSPEHTPMTTLTEDAGVLERIEELENENAMLHRFAKRCQARPNGHEATISTLSASLKACCSERDENERQVEELLSYVSRVQQENDDLKATGCELKLSASQHATLQKENDELKARILTLSPNDVISDAQINEKYEHLCSDIEDWVNTHLGDMEDVANSVVTAVKKQGWDKTFLRYLDPGLWKMLKASDASQLKVLVCMVQRFVMHRILSRYAFGVSGETVEALSTIEKQMKASAQSKCMKKSLTVSHTLANRIDFENIHMWRADALRALFEVPQVVGSRGQALDRVTFDAWDLLEPLFPTSVDQQNAMTAFHSRITLMAWELSSQLRTSPVEYSFGMSYVEGTNSSAKALYRDDMECSTLLDADTGSKLRRSTDIVFNSSGSLGEGLCVVFPVLMRKNPRGQDAKIGKATLLVKLNKREQVSRFRGLLSTVRG